MSRLSYQYLVRWCGGLAADNSWEKGSMFSENLHPYLEQFHDNFDADNIILPPNKAVRALL
ncbi:chromo (CHRromatin Organization MOdifier) domain protein [Puccinia sorghi]|uniref:Chromo (CHRromatin Organization MOdifier) domain protein n=1 Tax=Puccinia sorghi TaxID=27349 RepID=A0A0L6VH33_9BASI|nr:chromo (CHRromatin Organization MOdifier) domain protein [Puccinia sorghi]